MATRQVSTGVREILKEHVRRPPKPGWMYVPWHKITREHEQSSIFTPRDSIGSETRFTFPGKKTRHSRSNDSSRYEGRSGREKGAASRNFCARHATPTPTPLIGCLLLPRARSSLRVAPPLAPHFAPRESKSKWKFIPLLSLSLSFLGIENSRMYRQFSLTDDSFAHFAPTWRKRVFLFSTHSRKKSEYLTYYAKYPYSRANVLRETKLELLKTRTRGFRATFAKIPDCTKGARPSWNSPEFKYVTWCMCGNRLKFATHQIRWDSKVQRRVSRKCLAHPDR